MFYRKIKRIDAIGFFTAYGLKPRVIKKASIIIIRCFGNEGEIAYIPSKEKIYIKSPFTLDPAEYKEIKANTYKKIINTKGVVKC